MLSAHLSRTALATAILSLMAGGAMAQPSPEVMKAVSEAAAKIQAQNDLKQHPLAKSQSQALKPLALTPPPKGQDAPSPSQLLEMKERTFWGDPAKAELRNEVFDYLGIKPTEGAMYVFVSSSMPKALIQSYVAEALWAGAVLVVRGIPDGMTLDQWIRQNATPLVGQKGVTAGITIDPMLFDLYNVTTVPTVVWDETDRMIGIDCDTAKVRKPGEGGKPFDVKSCKAYPVNSYYAISGAVTLDYALGQFDEAGAKGAEKRLGVLRKFVGEGGKEQQEFKGDWDSYETAEMRAAINSANSRGEKYESLMQSFTRPYFESDLRRIESGGFAPGLESRSNGTSNR